MTLKTMRFPNIPGFDQQAFEKYFKNTGWLMSARVGSLAIKFLINTFVLSAYLGSRQFGILNYPAALMAFPLALAALGLDGFVTRELLNHPDKKDTLLGTSFWMRLMAGFAAIPLVYLLYLIFNHIKPLETPWYYVFIVAFTAVIQSVNIIDSFFQSKVQAKKIMYINVSGNIISAIIKLLFIFLKLPLVWFVYSLVFDAAIIAAGYILSYRNSGNHISKWKFDAPVASYLIKYSWPLAFAAILTTLYMKIDQVMIPIYLKTSELGIYTTVANLSESWYFIPVAIVTSVFPAIMHARNTDRQRYKKRLQNMYDLMVIISMSIAICMTFASKFIYHLAYARHPEFWSGAPVLAVHVWAGIFVFLG
ncbi:MAG: flippase, partial [Candidatus Saccharimonadales bacterium]